MSSSSENEDVFVFRSSFQQEQLWLHHQMEPGDASYNVPLTFRLDGELDVANVSLTVDRTPRFSYLFGYRYIGETDSNLLGFGMNYRIDEKHTVAFREQFDLQGCASAHLYGQCSRVR